MEVTVRVPEAVDRVSIFGTAERNLKLIREALGVSIAARNGTVHLRGESEAVHAARIVIERLVDAAEQGRVVSRQQVMDAIADAGWQAGGSVEPGERPGEPSVSDQLRMADDRIHGYRANFRGESLGERLDVYSAGRLVVPKTDNQRHYLESISTHDLAFCVGPAGTGKTYLAVAAAIHLLKSGRVKKAVLARPAVEAGEKLGYLPGDQYAKVNPYLRPLFDALNDMMDYATIKRFMASDVVEICPLAFMRGRTLNDAIIILDEAQNTTRGQMQMFLTRMGQRSKMIVTGDTTQIDLPDPRDSGLIDAVRRLRRTRGVAFCSLTRADVVRHELVQRIIDAYAGEESAPARSPLDEALAASARQDEPRLRLREPEPGPAAMEPGDG